MEILKIFNGKTESEIKNVIKEIPISKGLVALVDLGDYTYLMQFKWHALKGRNTFYAQRILPRIKGQPRMHVLMHRDIMKVTDPKAEIDHRDNDGLNNCKNNLRVCTRGENSANRMSSKNSSSKFLGVIFYKNKSKNSWRARIGKNGQEYHIGYFSTEEEAAKAYDINAKILFGEFANTNL